ncbi:hypothetical protein ASD04_05150 [Devosia sp. Root436]|uniref:hypothetical protein n=1 Tax=Devosia sp. Root436 TaxID=1736537 RepID=UPI0006F23F8D|nr:hypothetical protein [Devosia sp. Root436]KQX40034.1 hypothetical protein ASD04_05150 [Devosia sp. Root436]
MTKQQDFKIRLATVLSDLQQSGTDDGEAMFLLGSLAAGLADDLKSSDWLTAKRTMMPKTRDDVLRAFQDQGNLHHREGRAKQAYAIQALAMSLISVTLRDDPEIAAGEPLLDQIIAAAEANFRRAVPRAN